MQCQGFKNWLYGRCGMAFTGLLINQCADHQFLPGFSSYQAYHPIWLSYWAYCPILIIKTGVLVRKLIAQYSFFFFNFLQLLTIICFFFFFLSHLSHFLSLSLSFSLPRISLSPLLLLPRVFVPVNKLPPSPLRQVTVTGSSS